MAKIARLSGHSDWFELDPLERERTPSELMELGIRLHSPHTITVGYYLGIGVVRYTPVTESCSRLDEGANSQPASVPSPDPVALAETVTGIKGEQFCLSAVTRNASCFWLVAGTRCVSVTSYLSLILPQHLATDSTEKGSDFRPFNTEIGSCWTCPSRDRTGYLIGYRYFHPRRSGDRRNAVASLHRQMASVSVNYPVRSQG